MTLPTFLIIGAMKAGTTSLWSYLGGHPDVFVAPRKELNFFVAERNWPRGLAWYESMFAGAPERAVGEASPIYAMAHAFAGVPERIAATIPDVRLIYMVRHPVERMRSHYLHEIATGKERRPIDRAFLEGLEYLHTSRYAFQLQPYLEHFSRDRILVVKAEDLRDARVATLRRVFAFLGVDPDVVPPGVEVERHRTEEKRARRRFAPEAVVRRLAATPGPVRRLGSRLAMRRIDPARAAVPEALRRRIVEALQPDLEQLLAIAGPGFDAWGLVPGAGRRSL